MPGATQCARQDGQGVRLPEALKDQPEDATDSDAAVDGAPAAEPDTDDTVNEKDVTVDLTVTADLT